MTTQSKHIAIVGGGTAGWLAALILSDQASRSGSDLRISMVESSKIPTIGVGEGSTAVFRQMLQHFGFDEMEFLRETEATIKYGIRHKDWRQIGVIYDGPIDDPHQVSATPEGVASSWLNQYCVAYGKPVQQPHLFTYLLDRQKAPFAQRSDGSHVPLGPFHHAYHFDQSLVAKYLKKKAKNVAHVDGLVSGVTRNAESGDIELLHFEDAEDMAVDFVFDCTGFRKQIIGKELGAEWVSYAGSLPVNRAMPFWLDIEEGAELTPFTLAWAQKSGWMWSIPTQSRYGCGYVYSDRHTTPDEAQAEIENALGHPIEPRNDIKINAGRLDRVWINNCIAVGLSSSFLEPLEATSIHGTIVQLLMFAMSHLDREPGDDQMHRDAYNQNVARQVDDFMRFINLHYVSERDDSPFWRDVRDEFILAENRERLADWQERLPRRDDFIPFPGNLPHIEEQLYYPVLDGLGLLSKQTAKAEMERDPKLRAYARKTTSSLTREYKSASLKALGHREFLADLAH